MVHDLRVTHRKLFKLAPKNNAKTFIDSFPAKKQIYPFAKKSRPERSLLDPKFRNFAL